MPRARSFTRTLRLGAARGPLLRGSFIRTLRAFRIFKLFSKFPEVTPPPITPTHPPADHRAASLPAWSAASLPRGYAAPRLGRAARPQVPRAA